MADSSMTIAVVGGTGPQGRGLAYRFALADNQVLIGSRDPARAERRAQEINAKLPRDLATGFENSEAVAKADVVLLAVPWEGHEWLVASLAEDLKGKLVISCVNPLGFDAAGPHGLVLGESAAQQVQRLVPSARVVGAFHHLAAGSLWATPDPLSHEDVLVCGDDADAKQIVCDLARTVTGKSGIDAGALRLARQLEPLTAVLISINKHYKTRSGIAIAGVTH